MGISVVVERPSFQMFQAISYSLQLVAASCIESFVAAVVVAVVLVWQVTEHAFFQSAAVAVIDIFVNLVRKVLDQQHFVLVDPFVARIAQMLALASPSRR